VERQDSAALFELIGEHDRARRQLAVHRARFDAALEKAAANVTEPGEADVVAAIRRSRDDYRWRFDTLLASSGNRTAQYFSELEPRFNTLREQCNRLLRLNQEAMRRKAGEASRIARRWSFVTVALALALMAVGIAVQIGLSRAIVEPVRRLTEATERVAAGDFDTTVPVTSANEVGALAAGFNRMAERIRELRQADYQNVSRLKAGFIASASRELRAPLTDVQLAIHTLLDESADPVTSGQRDALEAARADAARLDHIVRELLDLSRIDAGTLPRSTSPVRPSVLVSGALDTIRLQVESHGVQLIVDVPPDLPAMAVDRDQIGRVITELVSNALAATPAGGTITVSAARAADGIEIAVADTGAGIPVEDLATVFEPFTRVADTPDGGAGLGLSIARRFVEAHGGQLTVESAPGRGSTFTVTLPLSQR
jgi:signal transduction histidine kinase